jgi:hypothetical protein
VGSYPYLVYYHLWLAAVPNFLHLAIPALPENVMKERNNPSATTTSFSEVSNIGKKENILSRNGITVMWPQHY